MPRHDGLTADWKSQPGRSAVAPTVSQPQSTSGPNDPLRMTLAKEQGADKSTDFPKLPGLTIVAYIDRGGMGHVYRAEQDTPRRTVAVKIATSFNRAGVVTRERFDREIQALAAINHPNIMPIYLAGDWHGFPFYAMRFMAGGPLSKQLGRFAGQTAAIVALVRKVVSGLQALHSAKIIHRDIKPHNLLLDERDEPVIADFGLAKWVDGSQLELTLTDSAIGTKYYMPPEQVAGVKGMFGPSSDIWALGVVLFELLVGQRPFREEAGDVFSQICSAEVAIPATVPAGLATIVRRCLQKKAADRYADADDLAADLDRWIAGKEIAPLATTVPVTLKPNRRKRRRVGFGITLVLLAAIASIAAAVWPSPPPKKKSIAERLRNGETVTLIGEKGMPEDWGQPIIGAEGHFVQDKRGCASLGSADLAARLFCTDSIDVPFEFCGECSFLPTEQSLAYTGLIFGYRTAPGILNPPDRYLHFVIDNFTDKLAGKNRKQQRARIDLVSYGPNMPGMQLSISTETRFPIVSDKPLDSLEWHALRLRIDPKSASADWDNLALKPIRAGGFREWFPGTPDIEPDFGCGLGITAYRTDALFRNVVLKPVLPPTD